MIPCKTTCKKAVLAFLLSILSTLAFAQALSGIYTIDNTVATGGTNFNTFDAAVTALNTNGISGDVVFNVSAGQTFTRTSSSPIITATGNATASITFQKSGTGANPVIQRADAGVVNTSYSYAQGDAVIILQGSDYINFNQIDITSTNSGIEYGLFIRKASVTDGCKFVKYQNGVVTMTRPSSGTIYTMGIYVANLNASSPTNAGTQLVITSTEGRHESIVITGCTIKGTGNPIMCYGYAHTSSPYDFCDQDFVIGGSAGKGNNLVNFKGSAVYCLSVKNANVSYNTIDNYASGGSASTGMVYGIQFGGTALPISYTANNNTINLSSPVNLGFLGIRNDSYQGNATIENNTISLTGVSGGTVGGQAHFISNFTSSSTSVVSIQNNNFGTSVLPYGNSYCISFLPVGAITIKNNKTTGTITKDFGPTNCSFYFIAANNNITSPTNILVSKNICRNVTATGTALGNVFGYYNNGLATSGLTTISDNIFTDFISSYSVIGIQVNSVSTIERNRIFNLTSTSTSVTATDVLVRGIYIGQGTLTNNIVNNLIGGLFAPNASCTETIRGIDYTTAGTTNFYFNTVYLNATSTGANFGTSGIYHLTNANAAASNMLLKCNIIINNSVATGTGKTVALRRSNTVLSNYNGSSNNNLFYAPVLFSNGTTDYTTLSSMKTALSPREASSFSENLSFLSTIPGDTNYLRIDPANPGSARRGAVYISNVPTDIEGKDRNPSTPDLGGVELYSYAATLPVSLSSFSGQTSATANTLIWTTASEVNNSGFVIERSQNGYSFSEIGFAASKSGNGNSSIKQSYSFIDLNPFVGINIYRLKQKDFDGKISYSPIIKLTTKITQFSLSIIPNPAHTMAQFQIKAPTTERVVVKIIDHTGMTRIMETISLTSEANTHSLPLDKLMQGSYIVLLCRMDGSILDMTRLVKN